MLARMESKFVESKFVESRCVCSQADAVCLAASHELVVAQHRIRGGEASLAVMKSGKYKFDPERDVWDLVGVRLWQGRKRMRDQHVKDAEADAEMWKDISDRVEEIRKTAVAKQCVACVRRDRCYCESDDGKVQKQVCVHGSRRGEGRLIVK